MNHSDRGINHLARSLGARRYLEIGVNEGETFHEIEIAERTGVDPSFRFDTKDFEAEHTRFLSTTSDAFFQAEPFSPAYDIIFIDGLHQFEQVVRDFSNSILRVHSRSVILIDDTLPNDVFSTLRMVDEALKARKEAGLDNYAWHGDVFKTVFYLHDFWPSLNYRTIVGSGNPQTLVWRHTGEPQVPFFNNLETISRLDYFELQKYRSILREASEDEALALCIDQVQGQ